MTMLRKYSHALIVVIAALAASANSIVNRFALDDVYIIQLNGRVHDFANQAGIWLTPYWPAYGEELGLYRPLAIFAYAAQWAVGDGAPWVFHLFSIAMHVAACLLVFAFLCTLLRTVGGRWQAEEDGRASYGALIGGLAFAVHPAHTEAVANIVGQAELIAAATTLAACLIHATRPEGPDVTWSRRIALVVLFVLGCLVKESAIVLPALLVAVDGAQHRWRWERASLVRYARGMAMPLFLIAAAAIGYLALRVDVLGSIGGAYAAPNLPFLRGEHRVLMAFRAWPEYVRLLFFPLDLSSDYSPGVILPVESLSPMAALGLGLLAATCAFALLTPRYPRAGLPAAWFIISILPVSNLLLPIGVVVAERLLYTPSAALAFMIAFGWQHLERTAPARTLRLASTLAAVVVVAGGVRSVVRNPDWKDTDAVWDALVEDHPESYRAQHINAARMLERGNRELGREYVALGIRLWPNDAPSLHEMALFEIEAGNHSRAIELLDRALEIAPYVGNYQIARAYAYLALEQPHPALEALNRAATLDAPRRTVQALRAQAYERLGRHDYAAGAWRAAIRAPGLSPWSVWALLARELARTGERADALAAAESAIAGTPPAERRHAVALRDAIGRGCYDDGGSTDSVPPPERASSCDPLAGWGVLVPVSRPENARTLQNARGDTVDVLPDPAEG